MCQSRMLVRRPAADGMRALGETRVVTTLMWCGDAGPDPTLREMCQVCQALKLRCMPQVRLDVCGAAASLPAAHTHGRACVLLGLHSR